MTFLIVLAATFLGDDAEAGAALDKFKADYKAKEVSARATAVTELAKTTHEKVLARLVSLLVVDDKDVRIAAARGLGEQKEDKKKSAAGLAAGLAPNAGLPPVAVAILEELGKLQEDSVAPEVEKHFGKTDSLEVEKAAVDASGKIRSVTSIDPLIRLLKELEQEAQKNSGAPGGGGRMKGSLGGTGKGGGALRNNNTKDPQDRVRELLPLVKNALGAITKYNAQDSKEWESWWRDHKATFKVEK